MWIINEEFLHQKTWKQLFQNITSLKGKVIGELKLFDLVFFNSEEDSFVGNGIYIIKEGEEIIYIGKASSRPFIERIGGHLDLRVIGGFNNLLKKIVKIKLKKKESNQSIAEAGRWLMQCNIILICMEGKKDNSKQFDVLENVLIDKFCDEELLNKKYKLKYPYNENRNIKDLVYSGVEDEASIT